MNNNEDRARALLERLRFCDANSAQAYYGSRIFGEAADVIESQRKELEELCELCGELVQTLTAMSEGSYSYSAAEELQVERLLAKAKERLK